VVFLLIVAFGGLHLAPFGPSPASNLKRISMAFDLYTRDHGEYPPLTRYANYWMFNLESVYPEYLADLQLLINPKLANGTELQKEVERLAAQHPIDWVRITHLAAQGYVYLPWEMASEEDLAAAMEYVAERRGGELPVDGILGIGDKTLTPHGYDPDADRAGSRESRPRKSERSGEIPVMFENTVPPHGTLKGANVLYADGHVEFVRQEQRFPATDATLEHFRVTEVTHSSKGLPFKTIYSVKHVILWLVLLVPLAGALISLILTCMGRIRVIVPFAAFMLYIAYVVLVSQLARHLPPPMPIAQPTLYIPLLVAAILSSGCFLYLLVQFGQIHAGQRGVVIKSGLTLLLWLLFWASMFFLLLLLPTINHDAIRLIVQ